MRAASLHDIFGTNWAESRAREGLLCIPAVAIPLAAGLASGHPAPYVLVGAGAFSVGFGSFHQLRRSCVLPMLLAAAGMCVASWIGTLAARSSIAAVCAICAAAFVYAVISKHSKAASWIALQCAIWLSISTAYPAQGHQVLTRGSLVLAGGLLQLASVALLWRLAGERCQRDLNDQQDAESPVHTARAALLESEKRRYAVRAAVTLAIAAILYRWLSAQNAYWIPMTALIVMRPTLQETVQRGIARTTGTIIGAALATLIVTEFSSGPRFLVAGTVAFAWISYALVYVNYAYFATSLTAYVVFLLSLAGLREQPLVVHRLMFTALGGSLNFAGYLLAAYLSRATVKAFNKSRSLLSGHSHEETASQENVT